MSNKIYAKARFAYNNKPKSWWEENNPLLENGEPGIVSDVDEGEWFKIGDGKTRWNKLPWKNKKTADQAYDPESENAQSGKAVAQAVSGKMDKFGKVEIDEGYTAITADTDFELMSKNNCSTIMVDDNVLSFMADKIYITGLVDPTDDTEAANKKYVDNLVGDINTALDSIIAIQNELIGGEG